MVVGGPGVEISDIQYRIPDLAVLTGGAVAITDTTVTLPPALVIEIASRSTARYDRNRKKVADAEFGMPAHWIVDPDPERPAVTEFRLADGACREIVTAAGPEPIASDVPFPVRIVPAELVAGSWRR